MVRDEIYLPRGLPNIYSPSHSPSPLPLHLRTPPSPSSSPSSLYLRTPAVAQSSAKLSGGAGEKRIFPPHHHRLIALFHGKQLRDLHVSASARFPAHHLTHCLPECFLLVSPPAAMVDEVLSCLDRCPFTSPAFIIVSVAEPL